MYTATKPKDTVTLKILIHNMFTMSVLRLNNCKARTIRSNQFFQNAFRTWHRHKLYNQRMRQAKKVSAFSVYIEQNHENNDDIITTIRIEQVIFTFLHQSRL